VKEKKINLKHLTTKIINLPISGPFAPYALRLTGNRPSEDSH
jgi:hypothetical protein